MNEFWQASHLWWPGLVVMVGLVGFSGFFSASETALFYLPNEELRQFRGRRGRDRMIAMLLQDPDRLLTAILFYNLIINLLYFAVSVVVAARLTSANLTVAAALYGLVSLFGIILAGEVVPKSIAVVFPKAFARLVVIPLALAVRALDPIIPFFQRLTRVLRRLFFHGLEREVYLTADDLEGAIQATSPDDEIIQEERAILNRLLELSEYSVEEVMWPRDSLHLTTSPVDLKTLPKTIPNGGYLLIWNEKEQFVDLAVPLYALSQIPTQPIERLGQRVITVPWCISAAMTLEKLRDSFASIACVVDEYGDLIGIVPETEIVDSLLLDLPSRTRNILNREPILEIATSRYHVDGLTSLRHFCSTMKLDYRTEPDSPLTVAGMIQANVGHLPKVGDETTWQGWEFRVIEQTRKRNLRALVKPGPGTIDPNAPPPDDEQEPST